LSSSTRLVRSSRTLWEALEPGWTPRSSDKWCWWEQGDKRWSWFAGRSLFSTAYCSAGHLQKRPTPKPWPQHLSFRIGSCTTANRSLLWKSPRQMDTASKVTSRFGAKAKSAAKAANAGMTSE